MSSNHPQRRQLLGALAAVGGLQLPTFLYHIYGNQQFCQCDGNDSDRGKYPRSVAAAAAG